MVEDTINNENKMMVEKGLNTDSLKNGGEGKSIDVWNDRYANGKSTVAKLDRKGDPIDYTSHPFLYKNAVNGWFEKDEWYVTSIAEEFFQPARKKVCSIGAGLGITERYLVKEGYIEHLTIYETSKSAIEQIAKLIKEDGIEEKVTLVNSDILKEDIPSDYYDAIVVFAAIHHFFEIEKMFILMNRILKRDGVLFFDEYVGPDHGLYDDRVYKYMDEINKCLASEYRRDELRNDTVRDSVPRATLEWMMEMDPSEGVHASQILPLTYKYFDVVKRLDYGGTISRPFWVGILNNFDFDNYKDQTVANLICYIEKLLIREGLIPHYHSIVVASKRRVPKHVHNKSRINYVDWK